MEQRDPNSPDSSEPESVSPAPSLPSPPILPLQVAQQAHRTTNFFIDNILRPDFGCRKEHGGRERAHSRPNNPATASQDSNCSTDTLASPKKSQGSGGGGPAAGVSSSGGVKAEDRPPGAAESSGSSLVVLGGSGSTGAGSQPMLWPAWVYCTRYSDRPSSG
uniref:Engrailed homeobox 1a n=1 Tax=Tetraodon nigroviridis TaxID=99883 RepID=H3BVL7_TETNG